MSLKDQLPDRLPLVADLLMDAAFADDHLEGEEKALSALYPNHVEVLQGDKLYVFNMRGSEWSQGVAVKKLPPPTRKGGDDRKAVPEASPRQSDPQREEPARPK